MNSNGYTTLAFKITGAQMRVIATAFYKASSERAENGQRAATALTKALDVDPAALAQIPRASPSSCKRPPWNPPPRQLGYRGPAKAAAPGELSSRSTTWRT